jgi:hypothetical protein
MVDMTMVDSGDKVVKFPVKLRRYRFRDPATLPQRRWIMRGLLLRGQLTAMVAAGGAGKSIFGLAVALHLAAGKAYGRFRPREPYRVAVLTVEEDEEELDRRMHALHKHFGFDNDVASRVHIVIMEDPPLLAVADKSGKVTATPKLKALEEQMAANGIDVIVLDPFIELWSGIENDNNQVKSVGALIRGMARRLDAAGLMMHHIKKGSMTPGDAESSRGAGAFAGQVRLMFTISNMTAEMALALGVESPKGIVRVDHAKGNYSVDPGEANWFRFRSVDLENDTEEDPESDTVGILVPWIAPGMFEHVTYDQIDLALLAIQNGFEDGDRYTFAPQSKDRFVAIIIGEKLDIEVERAARIAIVWRESGLLFEKEYRSPKTRRLAQGVYVNPEKRPSATPEVDL